MNSPTKFLLPRLKHGMIIAYDDYFCWSATQLSGERRAQLEFFSRDPRWELVPFIQFGWHGQSFVVEAGKSWPPESWLSQRYLAPQRTSLTSLYRSEHSANSPLVRDYLD